MDPVPIRVVISYRRDDASGHAGHLYADLAQRFGEDHVFLDIDNIAPGLDFAEVITDAIHSADVLIVVIGRRWLSGTDRHGRRKIDQPDDFVRLELESAIDKGLRVLPVLVQEAEMPLTEDLPPSLATLARRNALEISDKRWKHDVAELVGVLEEIGAAKAGPPPVPGPVPAGPPPPPALPAPQRGAPARARGLVIGSVAAGAVVLALVAVALIAVAGGGGGAATRGSTAVTRTTVVTKTFAVRSDMPWNDTGIDVEQGDRVTITATGTVQTSKGTPSRDSQPEGKPGEEFGNNVIPGVAHGALIGMIGNGAPFSVGARFTGAAPAAGRLFLGVNDKGIENNDGSYTAVITVS